MKNTKNTIEKWKKENWPPQNMISVGDLPIYIGESSEVSAFSRLINDLITQINAHTNYEYEQKLPRWMQIPKVVFNVERINILQSIAKTSKRFSTVEQLLEKCGDFKEDDKEKMKYWLEHNTGELIAHRSFIDLRAYLFIQNQNEPKRERFYECGLVIAKSDHNFIIQDHRNTIRRKRNDAFSNALGKNAAGWEVFGKPY